MIPYKKWEVVYEDSELDVRRDPQEPEGYGMHIKSTENYLLFPRGTLKEVALADRNNGKRLLENLIKHTLVIEGLIEKSLNYDSIIAVATKAYLKEKEKFQQWLIEEKSDGCF